ncbi:hypothetical protein Sjap_005508 [Stephania japonica]|uniref:RWP-RK domain-containing protein n=1 Tax=Stephania japonica TaxID=461633 RepID=A0AAP0K6M9_9MAGN
MISFVSEDMVPVDSTFLKCEEELSFLSMDEYSMNNTFMGISYDPFVHSTTMTTTTTITDNIVSGDFNSMDECFQSYIEDHYAVLEDVKPLNYLDVYDNNNFIWNDHGNQKCDDHDEQLMMVMEINYGHGSSINLDKYCQYDDIINNNSSSNISYGTRTTSTISTITARATKFSKKCSNGSNSSVIEFEEIAKHFDMPITKAAKELKIGLTALKKRCRELNIERWPHRKIQSLKSLIHNVKELGLCGKDIEMLEEDKRMMEKMPELELSERAKRLRQACDGVGVRTWRRHLKSDTYRSSVLDVMSGVVGYTPPRRHLKHDFQMGSVLTP